MQKLRKMNPFLIGGYRKMKSVASDGSEAIANVHGRVFDVGCTACKLYPSSGAAVDWASEILGSPYTYMIQVHGSDTGFLLQMFVPWFSLITG
jgi:hypothetical protein